MDASVMLVVALLEKCINSVEMSTGTYQRDEPSSILLEIEDLKISGRFFS